MGMSNSSSVCLKTTSNLQHHTALCSDHTATRCAHTSDHTATQCVHNSDHIATRCVHNSDHTATRCAHSSDHTATRCAHSSDHTATRCVHSSDHTATWSKYVPFQKSYILRNELLRKPGFLQDVRDSLHLHKLAYQVASYNPTYVHKQVLTPLLSTKEMCLKVMTWAMRVHSHSGSRKYSSLSFVCMSL